MEKAAVDRNKTWKKLVKNYILSRAFYSTENWTLRKIDKKYVMF